MLDTLTMNSELVDRMFPLLGDLIDLNGKCKKLRSFIIWVFVKQFRQDLC